MTYKLRNPAYIFYERLLKSSLQKGSPVEHVAIIQDGNRRYARENGLSTHLGHSFGADTSDRVLDWCVELGIKHLTLYAFSTENFDRDEAEKRYLFDLIRDKFAELARSERTHLHRVRVRALGRLEMLPQDLQEEIRRTEAATREYDSMYLNVALAYGGQRELVDAARSLAQQVSLGNIRSQQVDEDMIARHLYPGNGTSVPRVDLIIRTGGDCRTSNFLPWQANGNECAAYFCAPYWPEFRKIDFLRAIRIAQTRSAGQQA
ncbi:MAG TPA: polyprenyl diphosphate synthase [Methanothrix sp.]|jgi:tritrans,polycis-undecaprenyl-diphosphate synthase [geranylgeranyl-diphosphate specific]|nr:polyprenyl diphosphate synthase [Methanothrix sp.]HQJ80251.1 polyprenyl diphosphate synthase [Methanothrix sp.]